MDIMFYLVFLIFLVGLSMCFVFVLFKVCIYVIGVCIYVVNYSFVRFFIEIDFFFYSFGKIKIIYLMLED